MFYGEHKWNYIENFKISAFYMYGFIIEKVKGYMVHAFLKPGQI